MSQRCTTCSRTNPPEARYCFFDGALLAGHERDTASGQRFPGPFVFPTGRTCRSFDELILGCLAEWTTAIELLTQGTLENFVAGLGRGDLATAAREAARFPNPARGLDQWLAALPSNLLVDAKLRVAPEEVNLGQLDSPEPRVFYLELENDGLRLLHGVVSSSDVWLTPGEAGSPEKHFHFVTESRIPVQVHPARVRASPQPVEARLTIESNAGTSTVVVRAEKKVRPFPAGPLAGLLTPRQVAEAAQKAPKEIAPLFESGAVARWYAANGWVYPVKIPAASGVAAIQQFFEALGLSKAPKVELRPHSFTVSGLPGDTLTLSLEVSSPEKRPVFAHVRSSVPWMEVEPSQLHGKTVVVPVSIPQVPDLPGDSLTAHLDVVSNGHVRWRVPVRLDIVDAPAPVRATKTAAPRPRRLHDTPLWLHLTPAALLAVAVSAVVCIDVFRPAIEPSRSQQKIAGPNYDPAQLREPKPRLGVAFNGADRFGLVMLGARDPRDEGQWKRLTYRANGATNNTVVKIGTSEYLFGYGTPANKLTPHRALPAPYFGWRSVMDFSDEQVRVTQYLQFVPGQDNVLDTLLIYYQARNYGTLPQRVGLRVMLDTYIGANDGVPFTVPGEKGFVTRQAEYGSSSIPDYLEVVEKPEDSVDPGTIARVGLRGLAWGDVTLVEPQMVRICRFPGAQMKWDWAMEDMRDDSCVAVYWPSQELAPQQTVHLAMTYGLGKLEISDRLALSARRSVQPGEAFVVTAYVYNATEGQKVGLVLPAGVELVQGELEQTLTETAKRTQVFWKVRSRNEGDKQIEATSGGARARPVIVRVRKRSIFG